MHICFLSGEYPHSDYPHGGIGTFLQSLGRFLVKKEIKVTVIGIGYTFKDEEEDDEGVKVIRLKKSNWFKFSFIDNSLRINKTLKKLNANNPIDIIEGTELAFAFIQKLNLPRYLIRLHGGHHFFAEAEKRSINWWKGFQEKRSFKKADAIVGVSHYVVKQTSKFISFNYKLKGIVFYPVNLDRFHLANFSLADKGTIFFAGTVCEKKGIRQLIQAMPKIKSEIPEVHLIIAGRDWLFPDSGKSYLEYVSQYIDSSVKDNITFLGPISNAEIPKHIESAEVCCFPSHMETFGIVSIEAMAMAKPLVYTKMGPGSEVVRDGLTGLLCDPHSPDDIADKVIYLLKHPIEANKMGEKAREFVLQNFSLNVIGQKNIELYNSLL